MPLKKQYSPEFERVWNSFDTRYGSKGSKPRAEAQFKKLKLNVSEVAELVDIILEQTVEKAKIISSGQWCEPFQHVERYLRNRRFEDEPNRPEPGKSLSGSDQRKADAAQRYLARHLDEGVEQTRGGEGDLGGAGLKHIGILESGS